MITPPEVRGGVEEKKEDTLDHGLFDDDENDRTPQQNVSDNTQMMMDDDDEQVHGIQAQLQRLASTVFGSCGGVLEAATRCVRQHSSSNDPNLYYSSSPRGGGGILGVPIHPQRHNQNLQQQHHFTSPEFNRPPLSIAEELRMLAEKEGRPFIPQTRRADIPKFLGEDAVYSFDDDNISAISQNTLEEMARSGQRAARQQAYYRSKQQQQQQQLDLSQTRQDQNQSVTNNNTTKEIIISLAAAPRRDSARISQNSLSSNSSNSREQRKDDDDDDDRVL